jgi:hypothetical protein
LKGRVEETVRGKVGGDSVQLLRLKLFVLCSSIRICLSRAPSPVAQSSSRASRWGKEKDTPFGRNGIMLSVKQWIQAPFSLGPLFTSSRRQSNSMASSSNNAMPAEPGPEDCCQNGCSTCIWDVYREALAKWQGKEPPMLNNDNSKPLSAFERLELRLKEEETSALNKQRCSSS